MPTPLTKVFDLLEAHYGPQQPSWPVDPYEFLVWWHCGYPQSEANCTRGWISLQQLGISPEVLLRTPVSRLAAALKPGGMVPELRAQRLQEVATRVQNQYQGDLNAALRGPLPSIRKLLKSFPGIADPGADRILLFGGLAPVAAIPSNATQVLIRISRGKEYESYANNYKAAQEIVDAEVAATRDARTRAYLLQQVHGQQLCKRSKPKCTACPVRDVCRFYAS